jgi:UPF0042 nucleotide-binding protein
MLITGISGSGKSIALKVLEDDGFFCIDNLPVRFLHEVIASLQDAGHNRVAVAVDARNGESVAELRDMVRGLSQHGHDVKVLFLDARTDKLVQRYSETRRRHPMSMRRDADDKVPTLLECIEHERELMAAVKEAGISIDTSDLHPNTLRQWVREMAGTDRATLTVLFESFGFKHGLPLDADLVFDVRCLPNPFYIPELKPLTGLDEPVVKYLEAIPAVGQMIDHIAGFLQTWLPHYVLEHRSYLTVAIGCTGGQHRSVYIVEQLAARFRPSEHVLVRHRALSSGQRAA